jgi:hypothetical protein
MKSSIRLYVRDHIRVVYDTCGTLGDIAIEFKVNKKHITRENNDIGFKLTHNIIVEGKKLRITKYYITIVDSDIMYTHIISTNIFDNIRYINNIEGVVDSVPGFAIVKKYLLDAVYCSA